MSNTLWYGPIISSIVAETMTYPLLMIKTKIQLTEAVTVDKGKIYKIIKQIYHNNEFYMGLSWAVLSQCTSTTCKYFIYQHSKYYTKNKFTSGLISGALSSLVTHPVDVIRIYTQMNQLETFKTNIKIGIIPTLYAGYSKTLLKNILGSTWFFPLYEWSLEKTHNKWISILTSSIICTTLMQPLDYLKTQQSICIYNKNAWKTCFKGLSINLLRTPIHFAITMNGIDYFKSR